MRLKQRVAVVSAWVLRLKPVRVFLEYNAKGGPLLAAGLAYQAIFAVFAAIWVGSAIAGFIIRSNPELQQAFLQLLETAIPGLIDNGDGNGALDADTVLSASVLGWTGAIAAVGLFFTALSWLASGRDAVRLLVGLPTAPTNFLLLKLRDVGLALAFGLAILLSAALSVASTAALSAMLDLFGIDPHSTVAIIAARATGLLLVLVLDIALLLGFYRIVAGIHLPLRVLGPGALLAGTALAVLQALGTTLLGGARQNPLLASFAVIIGLLIWFNLICQVALIGASWIAVSARDRHLEPSGGSPRSVGAAG